MVQCNVLCLGFVTSCEWWVLPMEFGQWPLPSGEKCQRQTYTFDFYFCESALANACETEWRLKKSCLPICQSLVPEPCGIGFVMRAYVDADHAADSMTRKSRTGFLVFLNSAPIYWMSKKKQVLKLAHSVLSSLLWSYALNMFVDSGTSCEWWELHVRSLLLSLW